MAGYVATFEWTCPTCGRYYDSLGGPRTGFVKRAAESHIWHCARRTPAQRRADNRKSERRWEKRGTEARIQNDPNHPGLKD